MTLAGDLAGFSRVELVTVFTGAVDIAAGVVVTTRFTVGLETVWAIVFLLIRIFFIFQL